MNKKHIIIIAFCVVLVIAGVLVYTQVIVPGNKYSDAVKAMQNQNYTEASIAFQELKGYKDSETRLLELHANELFDSGSYADVVDMYATLPVEYQDHADDLIAIYKDASDKRDSGQYDEAVAIFASLGNYTDSVTQIKQTKYLKAASLADSNLFDEAVAVYTELGTYSDSAAKIPETLYRKAGYLADTGLYDDAVREYQGLGDYSDAKEKISETMYRKAIALDADGQYDDAVRIFTQLGAYSDAAEKVNETKYHKANALIQSGDDLNRTAGEKLLMELGDYKDSQSLRIQSNADSLYSGGNYAGAYELYAQLPEQYQTHAEDYKAKFAAAESKAKEGKYDEAIAEFSTLGTYPGAEDRVLQTKYLKAGELAEAGSYTDAIAIYTELSDYRDSASLLLKAKGDQLYDAGDIAGAYVVYAGLAEQYQTHAEDYKAKYAAAEQKLAEKKFDEASEQFRVLGDYSDAKQRSVSCIYDKAAYLHQSGKYTEAADVYLSLNETEKANQELYEKAKALWDAGDLQGAREEYKALGSYSDAAQQLIKVCIEMAEQSILNKDYAAALSVYQGLEQTPEIKEREYSLAQVCYDEGYYAEATSAYETLGQYELSLSKLPIARYAWADQLFTAGKYAEAAEQFMLLGEMTDSQDRAKESVYQLATTCLDNKEYDLAKSHFESIPGYNDADIMSKECDYRKASDLMGEGKNKEAEIIFRALGDYSDSKTKTEQCVYNQAEILFIKGHYMEAKKLYDTISFSDSNTKAKQCVYNQAGVLFNQGDYAGAKVMYASVDYLDSQDKANESAYQEADALYRGEKYTDAEKVFLSVKDYKDSETRAKDSHLRQGKVLMEAEDYQGALVLFEGFDYADSADLAAKCHYELGRNSHLAGKTDEAVAEYAYAVSLPEARGALLSMAKDYAVINEPEKAIQTLWLIRDQEDAQIELTRIAATALQNGKSDLALLAYSVFEEHPEIDFKDLYQSTSYDHIKTLAGNCSLLDGGLGFKEYTIYHFAAMARDYGLYDASVQAYSDLGEYTDSAIQLNETYYLIASEKEENGDQEGAYSIFISLGEYRDSFERANKPYYDLGITKKEAGEWDAAVAAFEHAGAYSDASTQILATRYAEGEAKRAVLDLDGAIKAFAEAGTFSDAAIRLSEARYEQAKHLFEQGNYDEAIAAFESIIDYEDSKELLKPCFYGKAQDYEKTGYYKAASEYYLQAGDYSDAKTKVTQMQGIIQNSPMFVVEGKGGYGYCNEKGEIVIPCQWSKARSFVDGIAEVTNEKQQSACINTSGTIIKPFDDDSVYNIKYGYVLVADAKDMYTKKVYDINGKVVFLSEDINNTELADGGLFYNMHSDFYTCRYFDFKTKESWEVCPCLGVDYYGDGLLSVSFGGNNGCGLVDKNGNVVFSVDDPWRLYEACSEGVIQVWNSNSRWAKYMTIEGKDITIAEWDGDYSGDFSEGYCVVTKTKATKDKSGPFGYIDKQGKLVIDLQYEWAQPFSEGLAAVKKNGKWGFIDKKGNIVIDIKYDGVGSFVNGYAVVTINNTRYYIDKTGTEAFPYKVN